MTRPDRTFIPLSSPIVESRSGQPAAVVTAGRAGSSTRPGLAVCFFGITRSLRYTLPSITANVLAPLRRLGDVRVYAHFYEQAEIDNPRSGEKGALDPTEYRLLQTDRLMLERPDTLQPGWFETIAAYGDFWQDGNRSLRNLLHQLHSLDMVTGMALEDGMEICVFCRPDLRYHDSLAPAAKRAIAATDALVQLPSWQPWERGKNDRFGIVSGSAAIAAYGRRGRLATNYCSSRNMPLHAESLLKYALIQSRIQVRQIPARASRVRFDGTEVEEEFRHPRAIRIRDRFGIDVDPILRWLRR